MTWHFKIYICTFFLGSDLPIPWPLYVLFAILAITGTIGYSVFRTYCRNRFSLGITSRSQVIALQQAEQSGLLVGNAPSGNVITLQQPMYFPGKHVVIHSLVSADLSVSTI